MVFEFFGKPFMNEIVTYVLTLEAMYRFNLFMIIIYTLILASYYIDKFIELSML
jgi:hypothetical protein